MIDPSSKRIFIIYILGNIKYFLFFFSLRFLTQFLIFIFNLSQTHLFIFIYFFQILILFFKSQLSFLSLKFLIRARVKTLWIRLISIFIFFKLYDNHILGLVCRWSASETSLYRPYVCNVVEPVRWYRSVRAEYISIGKHLYKILHIFYLTFFWLW